MSVFLNNLPHKNKLYPDNTIVHTYNSKVFADYDTAVELLMYKVLLPGEVAFAYYNDETCDYGINAIFAVGPLIHGGGNILFRNASELQKIFDCIYSTINDVNISINTVRDDLFNSLIDTSIRLDQALADCLDKVIGPQNKYQQSIDSLEKELYDIKIDLSYKATTEDIYKLLIQHVSDVADLQTNITTSFNDLLDKLDQLKTYIINYVQDSIKAAISHTDDKSDNLVTETKTELLNAFKSIQNDYYSLYNENKKSILDLKEKHINETNLLHTTINKLTNELSWIKSDYNTYIETTNNKLNELTEKYDNLYHRFIHHLEECPDSFNKNI